MKKTTIQILSFLVALSLCTIACQNNTNQEPTDLDGPLFELLSAEQTGIDFNNKIIENETYNHILSDVVFNGAGVAVIDINNDGLQDLFFAGNMERDRLYLNKGNLQFEDITTKAGFTSDTWSTAVAVVDINQDGWLDLYVGKYMLMDAAQRKNELYINNGDNTFTEKAAAYGIDHDGHCTAANFFDYDKDGDMDLYVGIQPHVMRREKQEKAYLTNSIDFSDRLFRNDGQRFTDVTQESKIANYNFTLSATVSDLNNDGWPDIYVASDYEEPDFYYQNNGDGTFKNIANEALRHQSNFSMGVDIADFNNDGWMDIYIADMAAADNFRTKANMGGMNPQKFYNLAKAGYHYQYMFNMLQLNNGNGTFSEIGQLSGVANTDWSWSTLFSDFDLDGDKDLIVTNGLLRDTKNKDYINRRDFIIDSLADEARKRGEVPSIPSMSLVDLAPQNRLNNYIYAYNGDLTFTDKVKEWGFEQPTWTQGGAYADLDNDGDLDLILNNMNDRAFIYRNKAAERQLGNYLRVKLMGKSKGNPLAYGAKVWLYSGDEVQVQEVSPVRGYMSSSEPIVHFGLAKNKPIDRLKIQWADGRVLEQTNVAPNQLLTVAWSDAKGQAAFPSAQKPSHLFVDVAANSGIDFGHQENEFEDFDREILLPHRMSRLGPCTAVADVNGDGLEDFFIGNAAGGASALFLQNQAGKFARSSQNTFNTDAANEDINAHFFDADGDKDMDLYVVSGGNEFKANAAALRDRLYLNDGQGNFTKSNNLPNIAISTGVAKSGDYDGDGDLDLFVGGRQIGGQYGYTPPSFILENQNGTFVEATQKVAPELAQIGMVTDAQWLDFDGDGDQDLLVVGEWMPLTFFKNEGGKLLDVTQEMGMEKTSGWWNRVELADFDGDGDLDFIAGNLGSNIKYKASDLEPFRAYVKDFDGNNTNDVYLGYYQDGVCYPVRGRQCSSEQMPFIKKEFASYTSFASATIDEVLSERKEGAVSLEAHLFESVYVENKGNGNFVIHHLPIEAQIAPIYGILIEDWNKDGHLDVFIAGNYYEREVETIRSDAGIGQLLLGNGEGHFEAVAPAETGIYAYLDVRTLAKVKTANDKPFLLIGNNNLGMQVYQLK